ncbi:MAG: hypothetical protein JST00_13685 [Deltaproteobacteria bacterium]|nr:hypothetical protein [Deltaproteobacteria bacterium]
MTGEPELPSAKASIDPPLFAGIYMFSLRLVPRFGVLHGAVPSGYPEIDRLFVMRAHDVERAREMIFATYDRLLAWGQLLDVVVKDRVVEVTSTLGYPDLGVAASELAKGISGFTTTMAPRRPEMEARARWNDLAVQLGLSFDPRRWHLFGTFDGIEVSVTIDGSPPSVSTSFRARWRVPLACGVKMRRGFRASVGFTTWKDGAPPGFPELDEVAVMEASDPDLARRALLGDPAVRSAIAAIAAEANFTIDDHEVTVGRGGFAGRTEIRQRLEELRFLVDKVTPPLRSGAGPFR